MPEQAVYTHGHHSSVVKSHARRTAQNSVAFLLPHIKPHHRILDVGCGPGSITVDIAQLVPQGSVIGIDAVEDVLSQARALAHERGVEGNLTFQQHDANELPFADNEFDIVFCHQVVQHVSDPIAILKEMKRVTRKGGIVAAREADYRSFAWYPELPGLEKWIDVYQAVAKANGAEPNAGRYLKAWAKQAGFEDVTFSWDMWNYQDEEAVVWAKSWTERALHSSFATTSLNKGVATEDDLHLISKTWREWGDVEGAFIVIPNGEILCRVP
ncbi:ubiE/COQ5 methyltransferase [Xylariaceae sp. AK1471]|nr:ubiE/COQ5 methyltransferase [Xylariaceae sp. AK1471]